MDYKTRNFLIKFSYFFHIIITILSLILICYALYLTIFDKNTTMANVTALIISSTSLFVSISNFSKSFLVGYNYKNMLDTLDTLYKHRFITEYEYRNYLTNLKKEFDKKKKHIFLAGN